MIKASDKVVCVGGEFSTCPVHNEDRLGPDPHPEMVGKVYTVVDTANWLKPSNCAGLIVLEELPRFKCWCIGCFRKVEKADSEFLESFLLRKPTKETEPA